MRTYSLLTGLLIKAISANAAWRPCAGLSACSGTWAPGISMVLAPVLVSRSENLSIPIEFRLTAVLALRRAAL